jgi:hypothetical protein
VTETLSIHQLRLRKNQKTTVQSRHKLLFDSGFREGKLKDAIGKAQAQFYGQKCIGKTCYGVLGRPFECLTDFTFEYSSKFKTDGKIILIIFKHFRNIEKLTCKMKETSKVQPCKN